jgi:glucose dehydrogenase
VLAIGLAATAVVCAPAGSAATAEGWARYGVDASRANSSAASTGITVASLAQLRRQQVALPGTVDSSAVYAPAVGVGSATHDVFIVTTTYGITIAIDAGSGRRLWTFTPHGYSAWAGSAQITTATPLIDAPAGVVYTASPDGRVHALKLANGHETKGWPVAVTRDPTHEKLASALNYSNGLVLAATDGYVGDAPPYQGHVVTLNASNGRVVGVWNSLCSDRHAIIQPSICPASDSAIWGRSAPVVDPAPAICSSRPATGPSTGERTGVTACSSSRPTASGS